MKVISVGKTHPHRLEYCCDAATRSFIISVDGKMYIENTMINFCLFCGEKVEYD